MEDWAKDQEIEMKFIEKGKPFKKNQHITCHRVYARCASSFLGGPPIIKMMAILAIFISIGMPFAGFLPKQLQGNPGTLEFSFNIRKKFGQGFITRILAMTVDVQDSQQIFVG